MGQIAVPANLKPAIQLVAGVSEFIDAENTAYHLRGRSRTPDNSNELRSVPNDVVVTPSVLRSFYNVPATLAGSNPNNLQGIAAFVDYFSYGALNAFYKDQNIPSVNVKRLGPNCFPDCDQYESDLDIQYMTAMGEGIPAVFVAQAPNYWILQFATEVANQLKPLPLVFSISYGWSELDQCTIATENCEKFGYSSETYVNATNYALMKLGTLGVSVLVSDGDDGAPGLYDTTGNCPNDPDRYCVLGGCQHTSTQCVGITVKNTTSGEACFFPFGIGSNTCQDLLNTTDGQNAIQQFVQSNGACNVALEQDVASNYHFYSSCDCSFLQSAQSNSISANGYVFVPRNGAVFTADYPTSSPYVTSVGATQFRVSNGQIAEEVTCSIESGAIITTGGGFSTFQPQLAYQQAAVQAYLQNNANELPPAWSFDGTKRGYPDVSFNGHNYKVFFSNATNDNCPCAATQVDGTSASSPALAGLITLINDQLLNKGKSSLGFLNYLLYQLHDSHPDAYNEVVHGNNKCNRAYCCQYGYQAGAGWDPVSGLGSINFEKFSGYVLTLKGAAN